MFGFIKKFLGNTQYDKTPSSEFKCLKCGEDISELNTEGVYRRKCKKCGEVNYRTRIYTGNNKRIYRADTKENYEVEKAKRNIYYKKENLKVNFGEELYNEGYKNIRKELGKEPSLEDIELYCYYKSIGKAIDNYEWWKVVQYCLQTADFLISQGKYLEAEDMFVDCIAYKGLIAKQDYYQHLSIGVVENVSTCFYAVVMNEPHHRKRMFKAFEECGITENDIRKTFENKYPAYYSQYLLRNRKNNEEIILEIIDIFKRDGFIDDEFLPEMLGITKEKTAEIINYLIEKGVLQPEITNTPSFEERVRKRTVEKLKEWGLF